MNLGEKHSNRLTTDKRNSHESFAAHSIVFAVQIKQASCSEPGAKLLLAAYSNLLNKVRQYKARNACPEAYAYARNNTA